MVHRSWIFKTIKLFAIFVIVAATTSLWISPPEIMTKIGETYALRQKPTALTQNQTQTQLILKVKQHLAKAHRYARSGITQNEIQQAYSIIRDLLTTKLDDLESNQFPKQTEENVSNLKTVDVCPEIRKHKKYLPIVNCTNAKPFHTVVSFVAMTANCSIARQLISGIHKQYGKVELMIGVHSSEECDLPPNYSSQLFKKLVIRSKLKENNWKLLIKEATSKYILIIRDQYTFDNQSNIERLIRIISTTGIDAVGGSQRYEDGRWFSGCYQLAMRNYTLRMMDGYDMSYKSCMYCDYLSTSFVSLKETLLNKLDESMIGRALFIDYFLQLFQPDRIGAMACADVMFATTYNDLVEQPKRMWQHVATKWQLSRIILPDNSDIMFTCEETKLSCYKQKGFVLSVCCLKELNDLFKFLMEKCNNDSIDCAIYGGNIVGSTKFYGLLPWERDSDMEYRALQNDKIEKLIPEMKKKGYRMSASPNKKYGRDIAACVKNGVLNCFYYAYKSQHWRVQMYGANWLITDLRGEYRVPTRQLMDGLWVGSYTNPGVYVRNMYGDDIFQHIEHWADWNQATGWTEYSTIKKGIFKGCGKKNFHGCLSKFLPEGNMQFKSVWM